MTNDGDGVVSCWVILSNLLIMPSLGLYPGGGENFPSFSFEFIISGVSFTLELILDYDCASGLIHK